MEYLFIYLLEFCDVLCLIGTTTFILSIVLMIVMTIYGIENIKLFDKTNDYYEEERRTFDFLKKILSKFLIVTLLICFIPSKQTLLLMGGVYLGKKAVNTVITDKKIEKVNTIIELELDKRIKELKGDN
jgi:hypothetical protein